MSSKLNKILIMLVLVPTLASGQASVIGTAKVIGTAQVGPTPASAVPSLVQQATCTGSSGTSITCTFGVAPTSGNCVLAAGSGHAIGTGVAISSMTGTNMTFTSRASASDGTPSYTTSMYSGTVAASAGTVVTINFASTITDAGVIVTEFNNMTTTCVPTDTGVTNTGNSNAPTTGAYSTTTASAVVFVCMSHFDTLAPSATPTGQGYTLLTDVVTASGSACHPAYKVVSSTGAQSASWTLLFGGNQWVTIITAFKGV